MKKQLYLPGLMIMTFMLLYSGCQEQPSSSVSEADMTEIKSQMYDFNNLIDESMEVESVHLFINKTDIALNILDNSIEDYLTAMANANQDVDAGSLNSIIDIKQTVAAIDIRLAVLDDEDLIGAESSDVLLSQTENQDRMRPPTYPYPYPYRMTTPTADLTESEITAKEDLEKYAKELHDDIVDELEDLKSEVNEFITASL